MAGKQAVVLIHGIGEQKPMETLRGFVKAVWSDDRDIHNPHAGSNVWSKPDDVSNSFELRRLTTAQNSGGLRTDFFEFYWAHLMEGTSYGHVVAWARSLLIRKPRTVPRHLRFIYGVVILLLGLAAALAVYALVAYGDHDRDVVPPWLSAVASVALLPVLGLIVRNIVGDAARYLHVAPTNIQSRHAIRRAGVALLEELHQPEREYQRIVLVGHSLGSVIGYDMLTHAWVDYHQQWSGEASSMTALDALEQAAASDADVEPAHVQTMQRKYLEELKQNGNPWRVTDFVTLGSPLAHAAIMLAKDTTELTSKQADREFPRCLPTLESLKRGGDVVQRFSFEVDPPKPYRVPHHAAVFAATRWTNLYFPCRLVVKGDLVGGPLRGLLGAAIKDVPVCTRQRWGFFCHTLYWALPRAGRNEAGTAHSHRRRGVPEHIIQLRQALDLTDGQRG